MSASNIPLHPAAVDAASTGGARKTFSAPPRAVPAIPIVPMAASLSASMAATASPAALARPAARPMLEVVLHIVSQHRETEGPLLPVLHDVQRALGCVPPETIQAIANALNLSRAEVHGVISFYPHFRTMPAGRHLIEICRAEACQSRGGDHLAEHARRTLGCDFHETTADGGVTLQPVYCLGLCARPPSIMVDGQPHSRVTAEKFDRLMGEVSE